MRTITSPSSSLQRRLRVAVCTAIFPNAVEPQACPFHQHQIEALSEYAEVEVVCAIPTFPGAGIFFPSSRPSRLRAVPRHDEIVGLPVRYPRRAFVPRVGGWLNGPLATFAYAPSLWRLRGWADVALATWVYPDAFATALVARALGIPVVIKAHGSDVNVVARDRSVRRLLGAVLPKVQRVVAVSEDLRAKLIDLGARADDTTVVRNGVDREVFRRRDRREARRELGLDLDGRIALFVGRLEAKKGVAELLAAFEKYSSARHQLILVGDGELRQQAEALARQLDQRVIIAGKRPHGEVARFVQACDVLVLPSFHEGLPNVILEALACGRRVVASSVGGIPEVVNHEVGSLVPPRAIGALGDALVRELDTDYDASKVADRGPDSWSQSARRLFDVLSAAAGLPGPPSSKILAEAA